MATITREQVYVERIQQLFNGTITAHESQINDEVVAIVDKMFLEITSCHRRLAPFAIAVETIAHALESLIPDGLRVLIGDKSVKEYLSDLAEDGPWRFTQYAELNDAWEFLKKFQKIWLKYTMTNQRMLVCINQARRNYHSALVLALMGI